MSLLSIIEKEGYKMKHLLKTLITTLILVNSSQGFTAVNIVECEDKQGNRSFQKVCPPESSQIGEKRLRTGVSTDKESTNVSSIRVILYTIPDCAACDEIKEFFATRNIPITEKSVNDNLELQKELTELTGGLKVPTTIIGDEVLTGYSRSKFLGILKAADYKKEDS